MSSGFSDDFHSSFILKSTHARLNLMAFLLSLPFISLLFWSLPPQHENYQHVICRKQKIISKITTHCEWVEKLLPKFIHCTHSLTHYTQSFVIIMNKTTTTAMCTGLLSKKEESGASESERVSNMCVQLNGIWNMIHFNQ